VKGKDLILTRPIGELENTFTNPSLVLLLNLETVKAKRYFFLNQSWILMNKRHVFALYVFVNLNKRRGSG